VNVSYDQLTGEEQRLSAPAHIAAIRLIALPAGFTPVETPGSTCRRISVASSHRSASRISGTSPADVIKFGSENDADTVGAT